MVMIFTAVSGMSTLHIARKMQKNFWWKINIEGGGRRAGNLTLKRGGEIPIVNQSFSGNHVSLCARRKTRALCVSAEGFWPRRRPKAFNRNAKRAGRHARFAFLLKASGLVDGRKLSVKTQSARRKTRALCVSSEGFWPRRRPKAFSRNAKRAPKDTLWPSTRPEAFIRNAKRAYLSARALRFYWRLLSVDEARSLQ